MKKQLEIYAHTSQVLNDAYDRVITEIYLLKEKSAFSSFSICGIDPGVGTTSIGINIALAMSQAGWKTVLVDFDLRKNISYKHLSDGFEYGVTDYLDGKQKLEGIVYNTTQENLFFIPSGEVTMNPIELLCSPKLSVLMEELKKNFDYVIVDTPALSATADSNVLATRMDGAILIAEHNTSYKQQLENSYNALEAAGANVLGVILNKADKETYRDYVKNYDYFNHKKYAKKRGGK